ncbi:hypothetical protein [Methanobrevibacter filiformis]
MTSAGKNNEFKCENVVINGNK